ncbi:response regulator [Paenibacillus flagellatus]|uniref:Response regulator receiver protein n=1 Tax=Paenibacillus flagellatus TaxID=2211139 RepID=A0A2V5K065_9BACL|nr:response regulator [Paenibacillus flagellatus]PYI51014.1 response regulator receiver protein [Paenibacillus flagellatus]
MKAILIDDEKPALLQLERLIEAHGGISVAGKFTRAQEALDHLAREKADVVFLDIGMPGMNGLEAGERLHRIDPDVQIVYVTAYNEYAVEAFELHAMDYLLKPVDPERFAKTASRLDAHLRLVRAVAETTAPAGTTVSCFKRLTLDESLGVGGQLKWRTQKAQELFAFLLHQRSKWITKDAILEALWPELGLDRAVTQLHTTVYLVRKMLKEWGIGAKIEYAQDGYCLLQEGFVTDVELFERDTAMQRVETERDWQRLDRALASYRGDYLEEHDYPWAEPAREELYRQFIRSSFLAAAYERIAGRGRDAVRRLSALREKEPYSEELCRTMMETYASLGDYAGLASHYESFVAQLRDELDARPDGQTVRLYERLMSAAE